MSKKPLIAKTGEIAWAILQTENHKVPDWQCKKNVAKRLQCSEEKLTIKTQGGSESSFAAQFRSNKWFLKAAGLLKDYIDAGRGQIEFTEAGLELIALGITKEDGKILHQGYGLKKKKLDSLQSQTNENFVFSIKERMIRTCLEKVRDNKFRNKVLKRYGKECFACNITKPLDAIHVIAVKNGGQDCVENGLPSCPNHHRLFDSGDIGIDPNTHNIFLSKKISKEIISPITKARLASHINPAQEALIWHYENTFN